MIISVDPGARPGWAVFVGYDVIATAADRVTFSGGRLFEAGDTLDSWEYFAVRAQGRVVLGLVEAPQHYARGRERNPGAILTLAVDAGRWIERLSRLGPVEAVWPRTWKGTAPKAVTARRVLAALSEPERAILAELRGDAIDAAGLGLWRLGRLNSRT